MLLLDWNLSDKQLMKQNIMAEWVSNGLTSARHDVFDNYLASKYPESFDAAVPEDLVYSGKQN